MHRFGQENAAVGASNSNSGVMVFSPPPPSKAGDRLAGLAAGSSSSVMPAMDCARFQPAMWLEYDKIAVGSSSSKVFRLVNPNKSKSITVSVDKAPETKGFSIVLGVTGASSVVIEEGGNILGTAYWHPTTDMSVRETALLKLDDSIPLQIILHGVAGTGIAPVTVAEKVDRKALAAIAGGVLPKGGLGNKSKAGAFPPPQQPHHQQQQKKAASGAGGAKMYDDKWAEKQVQSFSDWLNITFSQAGQSSAVATAADAVASAVGRGLNEEGVIEPLGVGAGLRTLMQKRAEAQIRQQAMLIFHSEEVAVPLFSLGEEICEGRLAIRDDRDVHADLGLQKELLDLLFSYELPWLRLGLEVVFGEIISLKTPNGVEVTCATGNAKWKDLLKRFIFERLFSDAEIESQPKFSKQRLLYATVQKQLKEELRAHLVKKFLSMVLVVDIARSQRLVSTSTLFVAKEEGIKSSEQVLNTFCSSFLSGEGNFVRHLKLMDYKVSFQQRFTDEYDYKVTNLAVDLRDGVRLARLVELLTKSNDLSSDLRVPAVSRLQKIHNVSLVLNKVEGKADCAEKIVDGDRDSTLLLLWKLLYRFELRMLIDPARVRSEAAAIRANSTWRRSVYCASEATSFAVNVPIEDADGSVKYPAQLPPSAPETAGFQASSNGIGKSMDDSALATALLEWCDAVAGQYGVPVYNLTSCLADGRALCLLVHYYHPSILPTKSIKKTTQNFSSSTATNTNLDIFTESSVNLSKSELQRALEGERRNYSTLKRACGGIGGVPLMLPNYDTSNQPEAKTMTIFLGYLFARLIESSEQVRSAIRIQRFVRKVLPTLRAIWALKPKPVAVRKANGTRRLMQAEVAVEPKKQTKGVTDVVCTVSISSHHAANTIKRLVRTFTLRRLFLRHLEHKAAMQERKRQEEEQWAVMMEQEKLRWDEEARKAAEMEEILLAQEQEEQRAAEEELRVAEEERREAEAVRLQELEDARLLLEQERLDAEAHQQELEEAAQDAIEEANLARAEKEELARIAAEERSALEQQLAEHETARIRAEDEARTALAHRMQLESRIAEDEKARLVLASLLEQEVSAKERAEEEAKANLEAQKAMAARLLEEAVKNAKAEELSREAEAARINNELLDAAIKRETEARELAEAKIQAEIEARLSLGKQFLELQRAHLSEKEAAAEAEASRMELEIRLAEELAIRVEEARITAEAEALRKAQEHALEAEAAVQAEREARAAAEREAKAAADMSLLLEARLSAIEEARVAKEMEEKQRAEADRIFVMKKNVSCTRIQAAWRCKSATALFLAMRASATKIQSLHRGCLVRNYMNKLRICASLMQSMWRQRRMKKTWKRLNSAALKLQSAWRVASALRRFRAMKHAQAKIACWWRNAMKKKSLRAHMKASLRASVSAAAAQAHKHQLVMRVTNAATSIARWFRALLPYLRVCKLTRGFRRLQAFYRARAIRRLRTAQVVAMHVRLQQAEARAKADPSLCLGKQTNAALHVLQSGKMISQQLKACQTLELSTQLSRRCCEAFATTNASSILFGLIRSCNRSTPHQELLRNALVVLLNVGRHEQLAIIVAQAVDSNDVLIDLMQMFRDKRSIFTLACELLCRLARASEASKVACNSTEHRKRLSGILDIIQRKARLNALVKNVGASAGSEFVGSPKGKGRFLADSEPVDCIKHLFFILDVA